MNPYDFVRIDWDQRVERRRATLHHQFQGLSGYIQGTITTLTPLFIPSRRNITPKPYITNGNNEAIIPGTSLKGLIRNLVETTGPGCWWLFKGMHSDKLPREFQQCRDQKNLCVACRLFGLIQGSTLLLGNVGFEDAICTTPEVDAPMYTPVLNNPKPEHTAWYVDSQSGHVAGRKFYFHNTQIITARDLKQTRSGQKLNQYIVPVASGNTFTFSAQFTSLAKDELCFLLYALALEPTLRHKIGYAKPAGLGSVQIALTHLDLINYTQRYTTPNRGRTTYTGDDLADFVAAQIAPYTTDQNSITLNDLRRIWAWPPPPDVVYGYPTRKWFDENPQAPISATKNAPMQ